MSRQDPQARRRRLVAWGAAAGLMVLPIIALRALEGSAGDPGDFVFLFILLAGLGGAFEIAVRVKNSGAYRAACVVALVAGLLNLWINLAVGIIGSEDNPANLAYFGVIAIALGGALIGRFRPAAMAGAMVAAAIAQFILFLVALAAGLGFTGPITIFFSGLWLISAWLFRRSTSPDAVAG